MRRVVQLESAAEKVCNDSAKPPLIFQIPPEEGRKRLEEAQDLPVFKYPAMIKEQSVNTGKWGYVRVYFVLPENLCGIPNIIYYIHGAGWVFGSLHTHDKLVRELAARTNSIVVFPEYSRSPEAKYPIAVEQCYEILCQLPQLLEQVACKADLTVTDACFNTKSYCQFAVDYYLYRAGMMWFWNQYTTNKKERNEVTASPLRAPKDTLKGLPDTLIITGEADVLRDEGENYARKLRTAGVKVTQARFQAIIHDFVMLNALDQTQACRGAMDLSTEWVNSKNRKEVE